MKKKPDEICEKVKFIQKHGSEDVDSTLVEIVQELYRGVLASCKKTGKKEGNVIRLQNLPDLDDPGLYQKPEPPPELGDIQPSTQTRHAPPRSKRKRPLVIGAALGAAVLALFLLRNYFSPPTHLDGCNIKGNIGENGEKIYHPMHSKWYAMTRIDEAAGERWFCTEQEARAAGWRQPAARK